MAAKKDMTKTAEEMMAPVSMLNELALAHAGKVVDMQLELARKYADMGLASWKAAAEVKDAETAQSYFNAQAEMARHNAETVVADAKAFGQLGVDYVLEAQKILKESMEKLPKLAA